MTQKLTGVLGALGVLMVLGAGCAAPQESMEENEMEGGSNEPIKIGWVGPLTGDVASLGIDARIAAEMAVEEINTNGGVDGRTLELVVEDGKCGAKDGTTAGTKLLNVDKVVAIAGGLCSGETTAIAPLAEAAKIPLLSGCSSAPAITNAGDYTFRSYPSDAYQGSFGAEYLYNTLQKKSVAVLTIQNEWGAGIKTTFTDRFVALGGTVAIAEVFTPETRDFRSIMAKVKNANVEAIYVAGMTESSIPLLRQVRELGLTVPILGADAWDDAVIHESGYAEGIMYSIPALAVTEEWTTKLVQRGGHASTCAPRTYDNVKLLAQVIEKVGTDGEDIKEALYDVKDFPGVNGPITFDKNGDPVGAAYQIKTVKDKKAEFVK